MLRNISSFVYKKYNINFIYLILYSIIFPPLSISKFSTFTLFIHGILLVSHAMLCLLALVACQHFPCWQCCWVLWWGCMAVAWLLFSIISWIWHVIYNIYHLLFQLATKLHPNPIIPFSILYPIYSYYISIVLICLTLINF